MEAGTGFAEPDWFPAALEELDSGVLFLTGEPGTGRRTAALNLLHRHSGHSMDLRAVDSDVNLGTWQPSREQARGYLVDGLLPRHPLKRGLISALRRLLGEAKARMVIVLPNDPGLVRGLTRDLHVRPIVCTPPPARAVFDARLEAAVANPAQRRDMLAALPPGALDELLSPGLHPAQVAELVAMMAEAVEKEVAPSLAGIRERLSFLAEEEVPDLLKRLRDDSDGLAFLLAACVFEGLDHRIVREEAERLLVLAEGRLDSVRAENGEHTGGGGGPGTSEGARPTPGPNPQFVFRRSLDELLGVVGARRDAKELHTGGGFPYAVEPVRFTRHGQSEAVLGHVWRQYGHLSGLLTDWMDSIPPNERDLAWPVGRVMGRAASWGGGRRALVHIRKLAESERRTSRTIAATALGMAAEDPVLAGEVKYRLRQWSWQVQSRWLRSTVAYTCETGFGASRPDLALSLLHGAYRGMEGEEREVGMAVRRALGFLFASGSQDTVFRQLSEWSGRGGLDAGLALGTLPLLLHEDAPWFAARLLENGEVGDDVIRLVRRALDDKELFDPTSRALVSWCRSAAWSEDQRRAVDVVLSALAQDMRHGVLRLFVDIDRHEDKALAGRNIAGAALDNWRNGVPRQTDSAHSYGRTP
ncbi:hypothetical protein [Streptomyces paludis]|nr:hypothetical protein [Streptomyces paludis]